MTTNCLNNLTYEEDSRRFAFVYPKFEISFNHTNRYTE